MTRLFIISAMLVQAGIASAAPDESAEAALKRGQSALKAGRVHEACEAFAASDKLAPSVETELSLASCYEQDGKTIAAAKTYRSVADKDPNGARRKASAAKAAKLEANAPKLRFAISATPPGLVVKVDGVEVPTTGDVPVDLGPHEVVATAPGFQAHASAPVDRERVVVDVILRMEPVAESAAMPAPPSEPAPASAPTEPAATSTPAATAASEPRASNDHRKRNGIILGASGVGALAVAAGLFALSSSKYDDEHALCPQSQCKNQDDLDHAHSIVSDARTALGFSIGVGVVGAALVAGGGYLLLTPHRAESRVTFHLEPGGAGIGYTARF